MPIFEYKCAQCNTKKDLIVSYDERKEPQECSECNDKTLIFVDEPQQSTFHLKGNGWFKDGY